MLPDEEEWLVILVEADRNVRPRTHFRITSLTSDGGTRVFHHGLHGGSGATRIPLVSLEGLIKAGALQKLSSQKGEWWVAVTAKGLTAYEEIRARQGEPVERLETETRRFLTGRLADRYPDAFENIAHAEGLLWTSEPEESATRIGHECREGMRAFADELVRRTGTPGVEPGTGPTPSIRRVFEHVGSQLGDREREALDALVGWWSAVFNLAQRQVHGQKLEPPLGFEDGRRLVFMTLFVMHEIDRSIG